MYCDYYISLCLIFALTESSERNIRICI